MKYSLLLLVLLATVALAESPPKQWSNIDYVSQSIQSCNLGIFHVLKSLSARGLEQSQSGVRGAIKNSQVFLVCVAISNTRSARILVVASHDNFEGRSVRNTILARLRSVQ